MRNQFGEDINPKPETPINAAKCLDCGTVLVSRYRHDFQTCRCGKLSVDGGSDYVRRAYDEDSHVLEIRTPDELVAALAAREEKP